MKNTAKKAVVLNNFSSPYISEAIIILKDYRPELEGKVISDAEKIVSAYIEKQERNKEEAQFAASGQSKAVRVIITVLIIAVIAAAVCVIR